MDSYKRINIETSDVQGSSNIGSDVQIVGLIKNIYTVKITVVSRLNMSSLPNSYIDIENLAHQADISDL